MNEKDFERIEEVAKRAADFIKQTCIAKPNSRELNESINANQYNIDDFAKF